MLDGGFFQPFPANKPQNFDNVITIGRYKVISVGTEAGTVCPAIMLDGGFFLPLPVNKPPDFSDVMRDCYKAISIGAEAGTFYPVRMLDGGFFLPLPVNKPQIPAILLETVTR